MPCHRWRFPRPVSQKSQARNVPSGRWRTCQGRFKRQTLTSCDVKITSTRTAVGQFKGQFNGAMERYTWVRFAGKLTPCHANIWRRSAYQRGDGTLHMSSIRRKAHTQGILRTRKAHGQISGAMEDMPGKVQKANTHILRCQNHKHAHSSRSVQGPVQRGDGGFVWARAEGEHTKIAVLEYTLVLVSVAVP